MTPRQLEYLACAKEGLTITQAANKLGIKPSTISQWSAETGVAFAREFNDLSGLSAQEWEDHRTLVLKGLYTSDEALRIVKAERPKIRAPRIEEITTRLGGR